MRKFRGHVSVGLVGCKREFEFEVEDDASDEYVDECAQDEMFNIVDWYYQEVE